MKLLPSAIALIALAITCVATHAQSRKEIYELQERCGKRAAELFEKDFPPADRKGQEIFENHYSVRLNKCFMLEDNTLFLSDKGKNYSSKFIVLVDVNDNKTVGSFSSLNCDVQDRKCSSEQEFRALIRTFMED